MVQSINVKEGQRYAQRLNVQKRASIWKVGAILATDPSIPHARLINVADPLQTKTISCFALRDRTYYELVAETATGMG
jgi:hypothetical protein